jgi:hypothetical protein
LEMPWNKQDFPRLPAGALLASAPAPPDAGHRNLPHPRIGRGCRMVRPLPIHPYPLPLLPYGE